MSTGKINKATWKRKFDGARPVSLIITMVKWIWTSRLSIKRSLSGEWQLALPHGGVRSFHQKSTSGPYVVQIWSRYDRNFEANETLEHCRENRFWRRLSGFLQRSIRCLPRYLVLGRVLSPSPQRGVQIVCLNSLDVYDRLPDSGERQYKSRRLKRRFGSPPRGASSRRAC